MQTRRGGSRIVFIFPVFGIAIKFPIIHFFEAIRQFFLRKRWRKWKYIKRYFSRPMESNFGFRGLLFGGLSSNWNEFCFYWKTKNSLLQPTYISFFGFFNIQRHGKACQLQHIDLWCQLNELTNEKVYDDSHHFANPHNFCFHDNKLQMLDYGSRRCQNVIMQYGKKIVELFNPEYYWKNEK